MTQRAGARHQQNAQKLRQTQNPAELFAMQAARLATGLQEAVQYWQELTAAGSKMRGDLTEHLSSYHHQSLASAPAAFAPVPASSAALQGWLAGSGIQEAAQYWQEVAANAVKMHSDSAENAASANENVGPAPVGNAALQAWQAMFAAPLSVNACSETLFGSLKVERLHGQRFVTRRQAKDETIAWLLWYNKARLHSTLAYVSPMQFESEWLARQANS